MEGVAEGLIRELVVADGGSTDATVPIARALGAGIVDGTGGAGSLVARGVAAARGEWGMILLATTALDPGWSAVVRRHVEEAHDGAVCFRLHARGTGLASVIAAAAARMRARLTGHPRAEQGLLAPRALLLEARPASANRAGVPLRLRGRVRELPAGLRPIPDRPGRG
jgi:hypothetical protein